MLNRIRPIVNVAVILAVTTGLLFLMKYLSDRTGNNEQNDRFNELIEADGYEKLKVENKNGKYESINGVSRAFRDDKTAGYVIEIDATGYGGPIGLICALDPLGKMSLGIKTASHNETENIGTKAFSEDFISRFRNLRLPAAAKTHETEQTGQLTYKDGVYHAEMPEYDQNGYKDFVDVTIENGVIISAVWDAAEEAGGANKRTASETGEYVMSETGMKWHEQADALEDELLAAQKPSSVPYDGETGKTDAVTGVTITVSAYIRLTGEALAQASEVAQTPVNTESAVQVVSGASVTSRALIDAVNLAGEYIREVLAGK